MNFKIVNGYLEVNPVDEDGDIELYITREGRGGMHLYMDEEQFEEIARGVRNMFKEYREVQRSKY